jgi:hypothetical protein
MCGGAAMRFEMGCACRLGDAGQDGSGAAQIIRQKVLKLIMCCRRPDPPVT